jgi:hypothetical protein
MTGGSAERTRSIGVPAVAHRHTQFSISLNSGLKMRNTRGLTMTALPVSLASGFPAFCRPRLDFFGVFAAVAPVAEAFKVTRLVIQVVPVLVVDLAAALGSATLAGLKGLDPACVFGRSAASQFRGRLTHCGALARERAITPDFEHVHVPTADYWVRRVLVFGGEKLLADWAGLRWV